nr:MAG TPA: hypothetical protein [Caudoviricetes sp.]
MLALFYCCYNHQIKKCPIKRMKILKKFIKSVDNI